MVTEEKLTGRELNTAVAEKLMGWKRMPVESVFGNFMYAPPDGSHQRWPVGVPAYSSDVAAAKQVEDRIAELGLEHEYAGALLEQTGNTQYQSSLPVIVWAIVRATPEERCRAALSVIETNDSK